MVQLFEELDKLEEAEQAANQISNTDDECQTMRADDQKEQIEETIEENKIE